MKNMREVLTYKDYEDFKYNVDKEYYFYTHVCASHHHDKNDEEALDYYRRARRVLANFEKEAITERINKLSVNYLDLRSWIENAKED